MGVAPGQWWQRLLAIIFAMAAVTAYVNQSGVPRFVIWISGVLAFLFALLSVPPLYRRWMAFAERLSVWMTRVLFTIVYVLFVPFICVLYMTTGRRLRGDSASLWIPKQKHGRTVDDLQRMG